MKADKSPAFWVDVYAGGRWRTIGCVICADIYAPECLRGRHIFYRILSSWGDVVYRNDDTTGFDSGVFKYIEDKVDYVVAYAKAERKVSIAPVKAFTSETNYGQGMQMRASMKYTKIIKDVSPLRTPKEMPHVRIGSELPAPMLTFDLPSSTGNPPPPQGNLF